MSGWHDITISTTMHHCSYTITKWSHECIATCIASYKPDHNHYSYVNKLMWGMCDIS